MPASKDTRSDLPAEKESPEESIRVGLPDGITAEDAEEVADLAREDRRPSTRRVYKSKWHLFTSFCDGRDATALPATPEIVGVYLKERAQEVSL
jgi:hypothetical protein